MKGSTRMTHLRLRWQQLFAALVLTVLPATPARARSVTLNGAVPEIHHLRQHAH